MNIEISKFQFQRGASKVTNNTTSSSIMEKDEPFDGALELSKMSCSDFGEFKLALAKLRLLDDKIIYRLNTSVPTKSFAYEVNAAKQCQQLHGELEKVYAVRDTAIKKCIAETSQKLKILKDEYAKDNDDTDVLKKLRKTQSSVRLMQSELNIEEVIQERSSKVFKERCWKSFKPQQDV